MRSVRATGTLCRRGCRGAPSLGPDRATPARPAEWDMTMQVIFGPAGRSTWARGPKSVAARASDRQRRPEDRSGQPGGLPSVRCMLTAIREKSTEATRAPGWGEVVAGLVLMGVALYRLPPVIRDNAAVLGSWADVAQLTLPVLAAAGGFLAAARTRPDRCTPSGSDGPHRVPCSPASESASSPSRRPSAPPSGWRPWASHSATPDLTRPSWAWSFWDWRSR